MKIEIQTVDRNLDAELEHFVRSRVNFALGTLSNRVEAVRVSLSCSGVPGRDPARRCQVRASLPGQPDLAVENIDSNAYIAIHRAVDRAGWEVSRRLERERRRSRVARITGQPPAGRHEPDRAA